MRQITTEDLHRLILTQAANPKKLDPWTPSNTDVQGRLHLTVDAKVENKIVSGLLGAYTYRNREQIQRLLARLAEWPDAASRHLDMLSYWAKIGEKYFDFVETFYIKPSFFETWRRQMHSADEDLPALAWLILNNPKKLASQSLLFDQWPTFIRGNDPQLYRELAKGYACLHLHLSGSYPAPYFWVGLMNRRFHEHDLLAQSDPLALRGYRTDEDLKTLVDLIELARRARSKMVKFVSGRTNDEALMRSSAECPFLQTPDEEKLDELREKTDVAQSDVTNWKESVCPSLSGERYLLYRILFVIRASTDATVTQSLSRIFWAYIVAKNRFLGTVQQAEGTAGFDYFEHTFRLANWRKSEAADRCAEEIGNFLQEAGSLVKLELMAAPHDKAEEYKQDVELAEVILNRLRERQLPGVRHLCGEPRVGLVVHFIKDRGEPLEQRLTKDGNAFRAFHHDVRDRIVLQFEALSQYLNNAPQRSVTVCGLDAANRELYCPPEVFAEVFRRAVPELRRRVGSRMRPLGRTFHVGEDFAHFTTGLRRIYEAICFLDLRPGDRLGHASALGLNPTHWALANPTVEMHLVDILDDAVFEAVLLRNAKDRSSGVDERRMSELMRTIDECCVAIYGTTIPLVQLEKAWRSRAQTSRNGAVNFSSEDSVPQWVREQHKKFNAGTCPYASAGSHSLIVQIRDICKDENIPADSAERIAVEYQHDIRTVRRFLQIRTVEASPTSTYLKTVQSLVAEEVTNRGIVIESNPSSNWLISGLESHAEIPAVRWFSHNDNSASTDDVAFTINPDDPAVFASSIENEYFMVYSTAVHTLHTQSRVEALRKIGSIREQSLQASFLD